MDKKLVKNFVQEYKEEQEWKAKFKDNHIEMCDYFKYSGQVEEEVLVVNKWKYNFNHKCDQIYEQIERNKKSETKRSC